MAMCVIAVFGDAPCQCLSPGANHTTSPGRISSTGSPSRCARPLPERTMSVCPSGCVCHAVRAPGSNVTAAPAARAGGGAVKSGSMRTVPVNQSGGPLLDGCEPAREMFMVEFLSACLGSAPDAEASNSRISDRLPHPAARNRSAMNVSAFIACPSLHLNQSGHDILIYLTILHGALSVAS